MESAAKKVTEKTPIDSYANPEGPYGNPEKLNMGETQKTVKMPQQNQDGPHDRFSRDIEGFKKEQIIDQKLAESGFNSFLDIASNDMLYSSAQEQYEEITKKQEQPASTDNKKFTTSRGTKIINTESMSGVKTAQTLEQQPKIVNAKYQITDNATDKKITEEAESHQNQTKRVDPENFKAVGAGKIRYSISRTAMGTTGQVGRLLVNELMEQTGEDNAKVYHGFRSGFRIAKDVGRLGKGVVLSRLKETATRSIRNELFKKYGVTNNNDLMTKINGKLRSYGVNVSFDKRYNALHASRLQAKIRFRNGANSSIAKEVNMTLKDQKLANFSKKMTAQQRLKMNFKSVRGLVKDVNFIVSKPLMETDVGKGYAQSKRIVSFAQKSVVTTVRMGINLAKMPIMVARKIKINRIKHKINELEKELKKLKNKKGPLSEKETKRMNKLEKQLKRKGNRQQRLLGDPKRSLNPFKRARANRMNKKSAKKKARKKIRLRKRVSKLKKVKKAAKAGKRIAKLRMRVGKMGRRIGKRASKIWKGAMKTAQKVGAVFSWLWMVIGIIIAIIVLIIILIAVFENVQINKYSGALDVNSTEESVLDSDSTIENNTLGENDDPDDDTMQSRANRNENREEGNEADAEDEENEEAEDNTT